MAVITRLERKSRRWEQVWQGDSEAIASIVAGRLEADGIRTRVQGHTTPYRAAALALGGTWAILVPVGRAGHARQVLRDNEETHNLIETSEDGDGLTESQKLTLRVAMVAVVAIALAAAALTLSPGL